MSIPGISDYPDLEQKYRTQLADARARRGGCSACELRKIHERFRHLLNERLKRDKVLRKQ